MSEIEKLNMIAEWQEQHKQLIKDLDNSKKQIVELKNQLTEAKKIIREYLKSTESWNYDFADILKCNKKAEAFINKE